MPSKCFPQHATNACRKRRCKNAKSSARASLLVPENHDRGRQPGNHWEWGHNRSETRELNHFGNVPMLAKWNKGSWQMSLISRLTTCRNLANRGKTPLGSISLESTAMAWQWRWICRIKKHHFYSLHLACCAKHGQAQRWYLVPWCTMYNSFANRLLLQFCFGNKHSWILHVNAVCFFSDKRL